MPGRFAKEFVKLYRQKLSLCKRSKIYNYVNSNILYDLPYSFHINVVISQINYSVIITSTPSILTFCLFVASNFFKKDLLANVPS